MRHAIRIQPYLPADLFRKLRAYSSARSLTVSAVVVAALTDYLDRDDADDGLIERRLGHLHHAVEELRRDLDALGVGFGRFVRYSFFSAPATADERTVRRAEALYRDFLGRVGEQLRAGVSFSRQVFPSCRTPAAPAGRLPAENDSEGDGQS